MKRWVGLLTIYLFTLNFSGGIVLAQLLSTSSSLFVNNQTNITLADAIALSSERPILLELTFQADVLTTLSEKEVYTFFAPSEEALQELQYENAQKLRAILLHHIVPGKYLLTDLKDSLTLPTLAGDSLTVFRKKREVLVDSVPVNRTNEMAKNGVIHSIADILQPKNLE
ncbi:hypothetical protein AHMF7605_18295 [Adhaeribacter arboris]|uniref:FAS1 domain-containing protein n=1 Tax=Adhaeribacter arboris TaxID=2072846 RepID=A0A2T2YIJ5_9BACT|nr:fasciclin domain-containing protein [Adhaeribacter arboris]PSR55316.1 hypothetical protein AHMF7605_18295 [Adhaeribacter arboris]